MPKKTTFADRLAGGDTEIVGTMSHASRRGRRWLLAGGLATIVASPAAYAFGDGRRSKPVVVLDPGHGGHDSGAVGATGLLEKTVALDMAFKLRNMISHADTCDVVLTREDDVFVPLADRVRLTQSHRAHLLVSLHADALSDRKVSGASVYTLSPNASDPHAAELAERENSEVATGPRPFAEHPPEVSVILESLMFREKQVFSRQMQRAVLDSLEREVALVRNPARSGNFLVLRSGSIPSILLEMGFMSNTEDELRLKSSEHRMKIAAALHRAIDACVERFAAAAD